MTRGLPFWLLGLEAARCPTCKRDNVWRRRRPAPRRCLWCGASRVDWERLTAWTVDVDTATHDDLREAHTATRTSRIQVLAPDETEAKLVACQMAAREDRMPTRATVVSPEQLAAEVEERRLAEAVMRNPLAAITNPLAHAVRARRLEP